MKIKQNNRFKIKNIELNYINNLVKAGIIEVMQDDSGDVWN